MSKEITINITKQDQADVKSAPVYLVPNRYTVQPGQGVAYVFDTESIDTCDCEFPIAVRLEDCRYAYNWADTVIPRVAIGSQRGGAGPCITTRAHLPPVQALGAWVGVAENPENAVRSAADAMIDSASSPRVLHVFQMAACGEHAEDLVWTAMVHMMNIAVDQGVAFQMSRTLHGGMWTFMVVAFWSDVAADLFDLYFEKCRVRWIAQASSEVTGKMPHREVEITLPTAFYSDEKSEFEDLSIVCTEFNGVELWLPETPDDGNDDFDFLLEDEEANKVAIQKCKDASRYSLTGAISRGLDAEDAFRGAAMAGWLIMPKRGHDPQKGQRNKPHQFKIVQQHLPTFRQPKMRITKPLVDFDPTRASIWFKPDTGQPVPQPPAVPPPRAITTETTSPSEATTFTISRDEPKYAELRPQSDDEEQPIMLKKPVKMTKGRR
jgi:hypothetical protein